MIKSQRNDESISYLAGIVGFNSASYFNKLFKEYVGCTPTEYRNSNPSIGAYAQHYEHAV